ncbi:MAG: hypothetical protein SFY81_12325 [Verrucomicrobiota bacterium]|nr:hypothetical protein [Verrucomicrobiota bacterium]
MKNYEIIGWGTENCAQGVERLLQLIDRLSTGAERLCLETHFSDFKSLQTVAEVLPSSRFAFYGWCRVESAKFFDRPEFNAAKSGSCIFNHRFLHLAEDTDIPPYGWNGLPSGRSMVAYWERYAEPVEKDQREPDPQIIEALEKTAGVTAGQALPVKTSTARMGDFREHSYMIFPVTSQVAPLLQAISEQFNLQEGVGSFEFLGSADDLEKLLKSNRYHIENFPPNCWSFNDGDGKTPFALERASFLNPVLNLNIDDLPKVAALIDSLGSKIVQCSVIRKYLSWKLPNGVSPHTRGNYVLLSKQKKGDYALFAGFDQYADDDPSPKEFLSFASKILGHHGVKLKSVPYPR